MENGYLIFDIESSKLWDKLLSSGHPRQAWICQFAGLYIDKDFNDIMGFSDLMKPPYSDSVISPVAEDIHGISLKDCISFGCTYKELKDFLLPVRRGKIRLVGHNVAFDSQFLFKFAESADEINNLKEAQKNAICTMTSSRNYVKLPPTKKMLESKRYKNQYKNPQLGELYKFLFNETFDNAHDAEADVEATKKCFIELVKRNIIKL